LLVGERTLIEHLKSRLLGLAAIQKSRARQRSRLVWLRKGDANTRYFQIMANTRKKRNFIHTLQGRDGGVTVQRDKHKLIHEHFLQHIGSYAPRSCALNFTNLGWQPRPLQHLDLPITEQELLLVIKEAPKEKAPGPYGFIGLFFSVCWDIIKDDLLRAAEQFFSMNQQGLQLLNQAFIVLIPKKECPQRVSDYRPIRLTHSFAKIITKILANRLGPELDHLIYNNQTAFIKKRCIHDSFVHVQEMIRELHTKKIPAIFIKLDISKAFDTVNWPYLLGILSHLGFGQKWRNWISLLWCTISSSVLLNGEPRKRILHCRG
jgi:hypothetical protein